MKIPAFIRDFALGRIAKGLASGEYGATTAKVYAKLKGKKSITGFIVALIGAAFLYFPDPSTARLGPALFTLGSILFSLGLIDKGVDQQPPKLPEELRDEFALVLSWITIIGKAANMIVTLAQEIGEPWALHVSGVAQLVALGVTTLTGFLATFMADPAVLPAPPKRPE